MRPRLTFVIAGTSSSDPTHLDAERQRTGVKVASEEMVGGARMAGWSQKGRRGLLSLGRMSEEAC